METKEFIERYIKSLEDFANNELIFRGSGNRKRFLLHAITGQDGFDFVYKYLFRLEFCQGGFRYDILINRGLFGMEHDIDDQMMQAWDILWKDIMVFSFIQKTTIGKIRNSNNNKWIHLYSLQDLLTRDIENDPERLKLNSAES